MALRKLVLGPGLLLVIKACWRRLSACTVGHGTAKAKIGFRDVCAVASGQTPPRWCACSRPSAMGGGLTLPAQHHAITRLFLVHGSDLRRAIDDMAGGNMAPCLVTAMMRLRLVHLHEPVGEGPHSAATRIGAASRASTWAWIARTMRRRQNLVQFVSLTDEAHLLRQHLWKNRSLSCRGASNLASVANDTSLQSSPLREAGLRAGQALRPRGRTFSGGRRLSSCLV